MTLDELATDTAGDIVTPYGVLPVDAYAVVVLKNKQKDTSKIAVVQGYYFEKQKDGTYLPLEKQYAK
jgi:hypothetical protein